MGKLFLKTFARNREDTTSKEMIDLQRNIMHKLLRDQYLIKIDDPFEGQVIRIFRQNG